MRRSVSVRFTVGNNFATRSISSEPIVPRFLKALFGSNGIVDERPVHMLVYVIIFINVKANHRIVWFSCLYNRSWPCKQIQTPVSHSGNNLQPMMPSLRLVP